MSGYKRKFYRKNELKTNMMSKSLFAAFAALRVLAAPFVTEAAVEAVPGSGTTVQNNGNVAEVTTTTVAGKHAINQFNKFDVAGNEVANLYLPKQQGSPDPTVNLFNLVKEKININGVVNGLKNGKIGGNLYFLSSNGMVVGNTGVINAGAIHAFVPSQSAMDALNSKIGLNGGHIANVPAVVDALHQYETQSSSVPLNGQGSIEIKGKLHAVNDIGLHAATILVGTAADKATLKTGVTNFAGLVNAGATNSGIVGAALTPTADPNTGDIVLEARSGDVPTKLLPGDPAYQKIMTDIVPEAGNAVGILIPGKFKAAVSVDGNVEAARDVKATAQATNGNNTQLISSLAEINVAANSQIKAGRNISLKADAKNEYVDHTNAAFKAGLQINDMAIDMSLREDISYASVQSKAGVNVGKGAKLTSDVNKADASQGKTELLADAKTSVSIGNTEKMLTYYRQPGNQGDSYLPTAGAAYVKGQSEADVTVDGSINSGAGDFSAIARSDLDIRSHNLSTHTTTGGTQGFVVSLSYVDGDNNAKVTIGENGTIQAGGDAAVRSETTGNLQNRMLALGNEDSAVVTAVSIANFDNKAETVVKGAVKANHNVSIDAVNTAKRLDVTAENAAGKTEHTAVASDENASNSVLDAVGNKGGIINSTMPFTGLDQSGNPANAQAFELKDHLAAGATVAYANVTNKAKVTIGNVPVEAGNELAIRSSSVIDDSLFSAAGRSDSYNSNGKKVVINASVLYAGLENEAETIIENGNNGDINKEIKGKKITVSAETEKNFNRSASLLTDLKEGADALEAAINDVNNIPADLKSELQDLLQQVKAYHTQSQAIDTAKKITAENLTKVTSWSGDAGLIQHVKNGEALLQKIAAVQEKIRTNSSTPESVKKILQSTLHLVRLDTGFAKAVNYGDFGVAANAGGTDDTATIAGNVSVSKMKNMANVAIGTYRDLQASAGDLTIHAGNKMNSANLAGIDKNIFANSGEDTSLGGTMTIQKLENEAKTRITKGAKLKADKVDVTAENKTELRNVAVSAGKGGNTVNGMFSYVGGSSNAATTVEDDVDLKSIAGLAKIGTANDTTVWNMAGGLALGNKAASVGAAVAVNKLDVATTTNVNKAKINAKGLAVTADSSGTMAALSLAGSVAKSGSKGLLSSVTGLDADQLNKMKTNLSDPGGSLDQIADYFRGGGNKSKVSGAMNSAGSEQGGNLNADIGAGSQGTPLFALTGVGSLSLNAVDGETGARIKGATINLNNRDMTVKARDTAMDLAASGAGAINWQKGIGGAATTASLAGTVGLNVTDKKIESLIEDSTITQAKNIAVESLSGGAEIAVGQGITLTGGGSGSFPGFQGSASVSVNLTDREVSARMQGNNNVQGDKDNSILEVAAYDNDLQITGAGNLDISDSNVAVGAAVTVAKINNQINAGIEGGTFAKIKDMKIASMDALTSVAAAATLGVGAGQSSINFTGAAVYNGLDNKVTGKLSDATVTETGTIHVNTFDTSRTSSAAKKYADQVKPGVDDNLGLAGTLNLDINGKSYTKDLDTSKAKDKSDDAAAPLDLNTVDKSGSTIVTAAASIGASGKAALGAAINIADINNDFVAVVENNTITAGKVLTQANADTLLVGVAGGIAGSGKFGGMGSVSWQNISQKTNADIKNSSITADKVSAEAENESHLVNVAGQVSASGKVAAGAALAYNALDNRTGAHLLGNQVAAKIPAGGVEVLSQAASKNKIYSIASSVAGSGNVAVSGAVSINKGANHTEAIIDKSSTKTSKIKNAKNVKAMAEDESFLLSIAPGISGSGSVAVGAGVAYTSIGGSSADPEGAQQNTAAKIHNTEITALNASAIDVSAKDTSKAISFAIGVGGSGSVAVQGAAGVTLVNKNTEASLDGTTIDKDTANADKAKLNITAQNDTTIYSGAIVAGGSGTAAIGAGVGVNRVVQNTQAFIKGGKANLANLNLSASARPAITSIGVGGTGAGTAAISGSVSVNRIANTVKAGIWDSAIMSQGNAGVVSQSDEVINNYAGAFSGAGSAAIGATVSVNTISGDTVAEIDNSDVTAKAKKADTVTVNSGMQNGKIIDEVVSKSTFNAKALRDGRITENKQGIVVDSSATHSIASAMMTAGGAANAAVSGTVNVNTIGGSTRANVHNSDLNKNLALVDWKDVLVNAADYTNAGSFAGAAGGAANAAVGAVYDSHLVKRETKASVIGGVKKIIKAKDFAVGAVSKQGLSNFDFSVAGAGMGAGVAGTVTLDKLQSKTRAIVENAETTYNNSAKVTAYHEDGMYIANGNVTGIGVGASVGAAVGIIKEESEVEARVETSDIISNTADAVANVQAENKSRAGSVLVSTAGGGIGAAVCSTVAVNNQKQQVKAQVIDSRLDAKDVHVQAKNRVENDMTGGSIGGALVGVGASVAVSTFDDTVITDVRNSKINAKGDITVAALQERDVDQWVGNAAAGFVGLGANVMVAHINEAVSDAEANKGIDRANASGLPGGQKFAGMTAAETNEAVSALQTNAEKGGNVAGSGVHAVIDSGSSLNADGNIRIRAAEKNKAEMSGGGIAAGVVSVNATVGVVNARHANDVTLRNATIKGNNIIVEAEQEEADISLKAYQGAFGLAGVGAAYGKAVSSGDTSIQVTDTNLEATQKITLQTDDKVRTHVKSAGLEAGVISAGAIIAKAENNSNSNIRINAAVAHSMKAGKAGNIGIEMNAQKHNKVETEAKGGAFGLASGIGINASATDTGKAGIFVGNDHYTFQSERVRLNAVNDPRVEVWGGSVAVGVAAAQATVARSEVNSEAAITVGNGNTFKTDMLFVNGRIGLFGQETAKTKVLGTTVSVAGVGVNKAISNTNTGLLVDVGRQHYWDKAGANHNTTVYLSGLNCASRKAEISGLTIGGLVAVGHVVAETGATDSTKIFARGGEVRGISLNAIGDGDSVAWANGNGGGLIDVSPRAANVTNSIDTTATAELSGTWKAGTIGLDAMQTDKTYVHGEATKIGAVTVTGVAAKTDIQGDTSVKIADGADITVEKIVLNAENIIKAGRKETYAVDTCVGAAVGAESNKSTVAAKKAAVVKIGKNAKVKSGKSQKYVAYTKADIYNQVNGRTAAAAAFSTIKSDNTLNLTNKVDVSEGAALINKGKFKDAGISLSAWDEINMNIASQAETSFGAAAALSVGTRSDLTRNNLIALNGMAESAKDLNLYAGAVDDTSDSPHRSVLTMFLTGESYNHTVLPLKTEPKITNKLTENNQVIVGTKGKGRAVQHVNLVADSGRQSIEERTKSYKWTQGGESEERNYVGCAEGKAEFGQNKLNFAQIDGMLEAGINNKFSLKISGQVVPDDSYIEGTTSQGEYTIEAKVGADEDKEFKDRITFKEVDYGKQLADRWLELNELIKDYSGGSVQQTTAWMGYVQERDWIEGELDKYGLFETNDEGEKFPITEGMIIKALVLPDMAASGGNITVKSDNMKGKGNLIANGSPKLEVKNTSTAYLVFRDAVIGDKGGEVIFQGNSIGNSGNNGINKLNRDKNCIAQYEKIATEDPSGSQAGISIKNAYMGNPIIVTANPDKLPPGLTPAEKAAIMKEKKEFVPVSTVEIAGTIDNPEGWVEIENNSGNVVINGRVNGKKIDIFSTGSILQNYTEEGICNIGSTPQEVFATDETIINAKKNTKTFSLIPHDKYQHEVVVLSSVQPEQETGGKAGSWIAGEAIYITASDININGLIQSGFSYYEAWITPDALDADKLAGYDCETEDGTKIYTVKKGGKFWDPGQEVYYRTMPVYYNAGTKKLTIGDITTGGGKIFLTGRISSTGNGRIMALDGASRVYINNPTKADLEVGRIINNGAHGIITITDVSRNKQTTYTSTETRIIDDLNGYLKERDPKKKQDFIKITNAQDKYEPEKGLRYNWTEGTKTKETEIYQKDVKKGFWGIVKWWESEAELKKYEEHNEPQQTFPVNPDDPLRQGIYIGKVDEAEDNFTLIADNRVVDKPTRHSFESWTTRSGFLGFFKTSHYRWHVDTGSTQAYLSSLKADRPIEIGFFSADKPDVTIISQGNINLNGTIALHDANNSKLTIISEKGAITQRGAEIKCGIADLYGKNGLKNISITSLGYQSGSKVRDNVQLKASAMKGDVDVTVRGGFLGKMPLPGNVQIDRISSQQGNVRLSAQGNITGVKNNLVQGKRIDLISEHGAIGKPAIPIKVLTGQTALGDNPLTASINAQAEENINLYQQFGIMRIGTIASATGDVHLKAEEGFVDALPAGEVMYPVDMDRVIQSWKDAGLIAGDGIYTERLKQDVKSYEDNINAAYAQYTASKPMYDANPDLEKPEHYQTLEKLFAGFGSAAAYLAADAEYKALVDKRDHPTYEWTQDQLLYAIRDSIINKESGSTASEKKVANITGKNIFLEGKSIGIDSNKPETISTDGLAQRTDDMKKLANAEAADVEIVRNAEGEITAFIIKGKSPLGVHATGRFNAKTDGNLYVAGRGTAEDINNYVPFILDNVTAGSDPTRGDIRILAKKGIINKGPSGDAVINGHDLILEGGSEDIGSDSEPITVDLTGVFEGRTEKNMYITNLNPVKDLTLRALYAGDAIQLISPAGIQMSERPEDELGYINAGNQINLGAGNRNVGDLNRRIRILANKAVVDASGQNIYLEGKRDNTLYLGNILAEETVDITSEGSLRVSREEYKDDDGNVVPEEIGKIFAKEGLNLSAQKDIVLDGTVGITDNLGEVLSGKTMNLRALNGGIAETERGMIHVDALQTVSAKSQILQNFGNHFNQFGFQSSGAVPIEGAVLVKTHAPDGLTVTDSAPVKGRIEIINLDAMAGITVNSDLETIEDENGSGDIVLSADSNIATNGNVNAGQDVLLTSAKGHITTVGDVTSGANTDMTASQGSILTQGAVNAKGGNVNLTALDTIPNDRDGNITAQGSISAAGDVNLIADEGSIRLLSDVTAGQNINGTAHNGDLFFQGAVEAQGGDANFTLNGTGNITDEDHPSSIKAKGNVNITHNGNGYINLTDVEATEGDANILHNGQGDVSLDRVLAGNLAKVDVASGDLYIDFISGRSIFIRNRNVSKKTTVNKAEAEVRIDLILNHLNMDSVRQRAGAQEPLTIAIRNPQEDAPVDNLYIGNLSTEKGAIFPYLWVRRGDIGLRKGTMRVNKLYPLEKFRVGTDHTSAAVYGTAPYHEGEHVVYWNNSKINRPQDDLKSWYDEAVPEDVRWIHMDLLDYNSIQTTNGPLVYMANYHYAYPQRYSAVDIMQKQLSNYASDQYEDLYKEEWPDYLRHGILYYENALPDNAPEENLIVI